MRFFLFALLCFYALSPALVFADNLPLPEGLRPTPQKEYKTRTSLLDKEYEECLSRTPAALSPEDRKLYCACFIVNVDQVAPTDKTLRRYVLRQDGWRTIKDQLIFQAAPICMANTLEHASRQECFRAMEAKPGFVMVGRICQCTGERMGKYVSTETNGLIQWYLQDHPDGFTPYEDFLIPRLYGERHQTFMKYCIGRHEYGWK